VKTGVHSKKGFPVPLQPLHIPHGQAWDETWASEMSGQWLTAWIVHSVQQKSIGLKFSKSCSGSHLMYICHHNSSPFAFPIFVHSQLFSVFHSSINPEVSGGWIPLQDKYRVGWKGQCRKPSLSSLPEIVMSYGPLCQTHGMKLLCLSVTFHHWLSPWHFEEWNQLLKQKGSGPLIKAVSFWKQPF